MPFPTFQPPSPELSLDDLKNYITGHIRDLNYLMSALDDINVARLDAKVIIANSITASKIAASTITATEIAAGTITADRMNVTQLSAISANLGTVTAGSITSNTTLNVGTDATIGNKLYLNANSNKSYLVFIDGQVYINHDPIGQGLNLVATGGVNIEGVRVAVTKADKSAISKTVYVAATSGAAATTAMTITNGVITA